jgi:hypothetical protein
MTDNGQDNSQVDNQISKLEYLLGGANPTVEQKRRFFENTLTWPHVKVLGKRIGRGLFGKKVVWEFGSGAFPHLVIMNEEFPEVVMRGFDNNSTYITSTTQIAEKKGLKNLHFSVLDIVEQELPKPADLGDDLGIIYTALLLMHLKNPLAAIKKFHACLGGPGLLYWDRCAQSMAQWAGAIKHPLYENLISRALAAIPGAGVDITPKLPDMFKEAGFVKIAQEMSTHEINGVTDQGKMMLQVVIWGLENSGPYICKVEGTDIEQWNADCKAVHKAVLESRSRLGGTINFVSTWGYTS